MFQDFKLVRLCILYIIGLSDFEDEFRSGYTGSDSLFSDDGGVSAVLVGVPYGVVKVEYVTCVFEVIFACVRRSLVST